MFLAPEESNETCQIPFPFKLLNNPSFFQRLHSAESRPSNAPVATFDARSAREQKLSDPSTVCSKERHKQHFIVGVPPGVLLAQAQGLWGDERNPFEASIESKLGDRPLEMTMSLIKRPQQKINQDSGGISNIKSSQADKGKSLAHGLIWLQGRIQELGKLVLKIVELRAAKWDCTRQMDALRNTASATTQLRPGRNPLPSDLDGKYWHKRMVGMAKRCKGLCCSDAQDSSLTTVLEAVGVFIWDIDEHLSGRQLLPVPVPSPEMAIGQVADLHGQPQVMSF